MNSSDELIAADVKPPEAATDLKALMAQNLAKVRNLAYRMVLNDSAADDVTQEVFMKALRNLPSFRGDAAISTWLYRITVNAAKEHLRKNSSTRLVPSDDFLASQQSEDQPDHRAIRSELAGEIESALARLSAKLRAAIVLTAIERLSAKEAALVEGCSTATMHWRIHQARKQLKRHLQRYLTP